MGGGAVLGVQKSIMAEAGVSAGESLTVVVRNDVAPRQVEVPRETRARRIELTIQQLVERASGGSA